MNIVESLIGTNNNLPEELKTEDIHNILSSDNEYQNRKTTCVTCEYFKPDDNIIGKCTQCDCPINYLATFKFKVCPVGKW